MDTMAIRRVAHWTLQQAAEDADIARQTLYDWLEAGRVTATAHDQKGRPLFTASDMVKVREEAERSRRKS